METQTKEKMTMDDTLEQLGFEPNMKVKCVASRHPSLTAGKVYETYDDGKKYDHDGYGMYPFLRITGEDGMSYNGRDARWKAVS
jgi:hypothetical protein